MSVYHRRGMAFLGWGSLLLYLVVQLAATASLVHAGKQPIDYLAYALAADALRQGRSPYGSVAQSHTIWRTFHQDEAALRAASARGAGPATLAELNARPQLPGPYLYPPTLALLIAQLRIRALPFVGLSALAILGWAWLWLRSTHLSPVGLLLIVGSLEVAASLHGGNVELILLGCALAAAWLLWHARPVWAAPVIALSLVVKPFYGLFFVAFAVLLLVAHPQPGPARRVLAQSACLVAALLLLEAWRWGPTVRAATIQYLTHAVDYQWFTLPVAEQTPMSDWNRTPLQALVVLGIAPALAQLIALGLWLMLLLATLAWVRGQALTFPLAFALALILLYWGRPVGWTLVYLEIVLVAVLWPHVRRWRRGLLLASLLALMFSRWWALALTAQGAGMPLLTLQQAHVPWETWLVLPLGWLLLLYASAAPTTAAAST